VLLRRKRAAHLFREPGRKASAAAEGPTVHNLARLFVCAAAASEPELRQFPGAHGRGADLFALRAGLTAAAAVHDAQTAVASGRAGNCPSADSGAAGSVAADAAEQLQPDSGAADRGPNRVPRGHGLHRGRGAVSGAQGPGGARDGQLDRRQAGPQGQPEGRLEVRLISQTGPAAEGQVLEGQDLLLPGHQRARTDLQAAGLPRARRLSEGLHDQQARRVRDPGQARRRGRKGNLLTQILIDILKNLLPSNSALKAAIVAGFQVSEVHKTTVDFIVEEIFRSAK